MKIESGLNSYNYQSRSSDVERRPEESALRENEAPTRLSASTVESSTLLSTSLANALWIVGDGSKTVRAEPETSRPSTVSPRGEEWVAERYREFGEF